MSMLPAMASPSIQVGLHCCLIDCHHCLSPASVLCMQESVIAIQPDDLLMTVCDRDLRCLPQHHSQLKHRWTSSPISWMASSRHGCQFMRNQLSWAHRSSCNDRRHSRCQLQQKPRPLRPSCPHARPPALPPPWPGAPCSTTASPSWPPTPTLLHHRLARMQMLQHHVNGSPPQHQTPMQRVQRTHHPHHRMQMWHTDGVGQTSQLSARSDPPGQ